MSGSFSQCSFIVLIATTWPLASCDKSVNVPDASVRAEVKPEGGVLPPYSCRHNSDSQRDDEESERLTLIAHPWVRIGPELYDGSDDATATITLDSTSWKVIATSMQVEHIVETRSIASMVREAQGLEEILAKPAAYKDKSILIRCDWINHVEGAWLAPTAEASLERTLSIGRSMSAWFVRANGAELMSQWELEGRQGVVVSGTLRVGNFDAGMVVMENQPYIEPRVVIALESNGEAEDGARVPR